MGGKNAPEEKESVVEQKQVEYEMNPKFLFWEPKFANFHFVIIPRRGFTNTFYFKFFDGSLSKSAERLFLTKSRVYVDYYVGEESFSGMVTMEKTQKGEFGKSDFYLKVSPPMGLHTLRPVNIAKKIDRIQIKIDHKKFNKTGKPYEFMIEQSQMFFLPQRKFWALESDIMFDLESDAGKEDEFSQRKLVDVLRKMCREEKISMKDLQVMGIEGE